MTSEPPQPPELPDQPSAPPAPPAPQPYPQPYGSYGMTPHPSGTSSTERSTAMWAWLAAILVSMFVCGLGFIGPLIILNTNSSGSPFVRAHAVESLNVQITVAIASIAMIVLWILSFVAMMFLPFLFVFGFALLAVPAVASVYGLVVSIIGAVRANNGEFYRAPVVIRFVK